MNEMMEGLLIINREVKTNSEKITKLSEELRQISQRFSSPMYGPLLEEGELDT